MAITVSPVLSWLFLVLESHVIPGLCSLFSPSLHPKMIFQLTGKDYESSGQQRGQGWLLGNTSLSYAAFYLAFGQQPLFLLHLLRELEQKFARLCQQS